MDESYLNDKREIHEMKTITFSNYEKKLVKEILVKSLSKNLIEESLDWSIELISSGQYLDLWECIFFYYSKYIHISNPKLSIYLNSQLDLFKEIINNNSDNILSLRNNPKIRNLFSDIIIILSLSKIKFILEFKKLNSNQENILLNIKNNFKAKNLNYIKDIFQEEDSKELYLPLNEFYFHLSNDSKDSFLACYWLEWILEYENICKLEKIFLKCESRNFLNNNINSKFNHDIIWLIWDCFFKITENNIPLQKIINSLFNLFTLKFSLTLKKKRKGIIYSCIFFITHDYNFNTPIINDKKLLVDIRNNINIFYKQIKINEIKPDTDYLFKDIKNLNKEKSLEKFKTIDAIINK